MKKLIIFIAILYLSSCFGFGDIIDTISSTTNTVTNAGNSAIDSTTSLFNNAINTIKNTANSAVSETTSAISGAINTMKQTATKVISDAQDAMYGAIDNLKDFTNSVIDKIKGLADYMCQSECVSFYNLPCFILFGCTVKLRNFFLMIVLPVVLFFVLMFGMCTGLISIPCLFRILGVVTLIYPLYLLIKCCCCKKKQEEEEKKQEKAKGKEDPPQTQTRMIKT